MSSRMLLQDAEAGDSVVAKVALLDGDAPAAGQDASSGYLELYHWRLVQAMQSQIHSASLANDRLFGSPATPWTGNTDGSSGVHLPTESPLTRETAAHSAHSVPAWQSPSVADGATPFSGGGGSSHHLRATSSSRSLRGSSVNTPLASSASRGFIHTTYPPSAGTPLPALDEHHSHSVSELQHLDDEIAQMNHELGASAANDTPLPAAHDVYGVGGGRRSGSHSRVSAGEVSSAAREAPQVPATPAVTPAAGIAGLIGPESRRRILTGVSLRGLPLSPAMREAKERNEKVTDVEDRARRDVESAAKPKPKRATSERTWQDSLRKFALATPDTAAPPRPKRAATFVVEQRKSPMGEFEATPVAVTPAPLQALLHREQAADAPKPDVVEVAETPAGGEGVGVTVPPAAAARPARARHARVGSELIDYEHAAPAVEVFQDSTGPSPLGSPLHGSPPTAAPTATPPGDPEPAPHGPTPTPAPLNFMTPAREQPESPAPPPVAGNITPEELFPAHSQSAREASVDGDDRGSGVLDVVRPSVGALAHMTPRAARHEASLTCLQSALVCAGMADAIAGALARGGSHGLRGVWSSPTPPVSARQEQRLARQGLFRARQAVLYLGDALGVVSSFPPQMRDAQWSALRSELGAAATSLHQTVRRATAHYRAFHGSDPMRAARGAEFPDAARYADIALVRSLHAVAESPYAARSRSRSPVSDRMVPLASPSVPSSGYGQSPPRSDRGSLAPQDVAVMGYADLVTRLQRLQSRHRESPVQSAAGGAVDDVSPREEMARVLDESLLVGEIIRRSKGGKPARRPSKLGTNDPPPKSDSELARIPTLDPAGIEADASAPASLPPQPPSGAPEAQSRQGSFGFPALAASQATAEAARGSLTSQEEQMVEDAVALAMSLVRKSSLGADDDDIGDVDDVDDVALSEPLGTLPTVPERAAIDGRGRRVPSRGRGGGRGGRKPDLHVDVPHNAAGAIRVESSAKATREGAPTPEAAADGAARSPAFAVRRAGLPSKQASGSNKRGAGAWATDNLRRSPGPKWAPDERLPFDAVLSESEQARREEAQGSAAKDARTSVDGRGPGVWALDPLRRAPPPNWTPERESRSEKAAPAAADAGQSPDVPEGTSGTGWAPRDGLADDGAAADTRQPAQARAGAPRGGWAPADPPASAQAQGAAASPAGEALRAAGGWAPSPEDGLTGAGSEARTGGKWTLVDGAATPVEAASPRAGRWAPGEEPRAAEAARGPQRAPPVSKDDSRRWTPDAGPPVRGASRGSDAAEAAATPAAGRAQSREGWVPDAGATASTAGPGRGPSRPSDGKRPESYMTATGKWAPDGAGAPRRGAQPEGEPLQRRAPSSKGLPGAFVPGADEARRTPVSPRGVSPGTGVAQGGPAGHREAADAWVPTEAARAGRAAARGAAGRGRGRGRGRADRTPPRQNKKQSLGLEFQSPYAVRDATLTREAAPGRGGGATDATRDAWAPGAMRGRPATAMPLAERLSRDARDASQTSVQTQRWAPGEDDDAPRVTRAAARLANTSGAGQRDGAGGSRQESAALFGPEMGAEGGAAGRDAKPQGGVKGGVEIGAPVGVVAAQAAIAAPFAKPSGLQAIAEGKSWVPGASEATKTAPKSTSAVPDDNKDVAGSNPVKSLFGAVGWLLTLGRRGQTSGPTRPEDGSDAARRAIEAGDAPQWSPAATLAAPAPAGAGRASADRERRLESTASQSRMTAPKASAPSASGVTDAPRSDALRVDEDTWAPSRKAALPARGQSLRAIPGAGAKRAEEAPRAIPRRSASSQALTSLARLRAEFAAAVSNSERAAESRQLLSPDASNEGPASQGAQPSATLAAGGASSWAPGAGGGEGEARALPGRASSRRAAPEISAARDKADAVAERGGVPRRELAGRAAQPAAGSRRQLLAALEAAESALQSSAQGAGAETEARSPGNAFSGIFGAIGRLVGVGRSPTPKHAASGGEASAVVGGSQRAAGEPAATANVAAVAARTMPADQRKPSSRAIDARGLGLPGGGAAALRSGETSTAGAALITGQRKATAQAERPAAAGPAPPATSKLPTGGAPWAPDGPASRDVETPTPPPGDTRERPERERGRVARRATAAFATVVVAAAGAVGAFMAGAQPVSDPRRTPSATPASQPVKARAPPNASPVSKDATKRQAASARSRSSERAPAREQQRRSDAKVSKQRAASTGPAGVPRLEKVLGAPKPMGGDAGGIAPVAVAAAATATAAALGAVFAGAKALSGKGAEQGRAPAKRDGDGAEEGAIGTAGRDVGVMAGSPAPQLRRGAAERAVPGDKLRGAGETLAIMKDAGARGAKAGSPSRRSREAMRVALGTAKEAAAAKSQTAVFVPGATIDGGKDVDAVGAGRRAPGGGQRAPEASRTRAAAVAAARGRPGAAFAPGIESHEVAEGVDASGGADTAASKAVAGSRQVAGAAKRGVVRAGEDPQARSATFVPGATKDAGRAAVPGRDGADAKNAVAQATAQSALRSRSPTGTRGEVLFGARAGAAKPVQQAAGRSAGKQAAVRVGGDPKVQSVAFVPGDGAGAIGRGVDGRQAAGQQPRGGNRRDQRPTASPGASAGAGAFAPGSDADGQATGPRGGVVGPAGGRAATAGNLRGAAGVQARDARSAAVGFSPGAQPAAGRARAPAAASAPPSRRATPQRAAGSPLRGARDATATEVRAGVRSPSPAKAARQGQDAGPRAGAREGANGKQRGADGSGSPLKVTPARHARAPAVADGERRTPNRAARRATATVATVAVAVAGAFGAFLVGSQPASGPGGASSRPDGRPRAPIQRAPAGADTAGKPAPRPSAPQPAKSAASPPAAAPVASRAPARVQGLGSALPARGAGGEGAGMAAVAVAAAATATATAVGAVVAGAKALGGRSKGTTPEGTGTKGHTAGGYSPARGRGAAAAAGQASGKVQGSGQAGGGAKARNAQPDAPGAPRTAGPASAIGFSPVRGATATVQGKGDAQRAGAGAADAASQERRLTAGAGGVRPSPDGDGARAADAVRITRRDVGRRAAGPGAGGGTQGVPSDAQGPAAIQKTREQQLRAGRSEARRSPSQLASATAGSDPKAQEAVFVPGAARDAGQPAAPRRAAAATSTPAATAAERGKAASAARDRPVPQDIVSHEVRGGVDSTGDTEPADAKRTGTSARLLAARTVADPQARSATSVSGLTQVSGQRPADGGRKDAGTAQQDRKAPGRNIAASVAQKGAAGAALAGIESHEIRGGVDASVGAGAGGARGARGAAMGSVQQGVVKAGEDPQARSAVFVPGDSGARERTAQRAAIDQAPGDTRGDTGGRIESGVQTTPAGAPGASSQERPPGSANKTLPAKVDSKRGEVAMRSPRTAASSNTASRSAGRAPGGDTLDTAASRQPRGTAAAPPVVAGFTPSGTQRQGRSPGSGERGRQVPGAGGVEYGPGTEASPHRGARRTAAVATMAVAAAGALGAFLVGAQPAPRPSAGAPSSAKATPGASKGDAPARPAPRPSAPQPAKSAASPPSRAATGQPVPRLPAKVQGLGSALPARGAGGEGAGMAAVAVAAAATATATAVGAVVAGAKALGGRSKGATPEGTGTTRHAAGGYTPARADASTLSKTPGGGRAAVGGQVSRRDLGQKAPGKVATPSAERQAGDRDSASERSPQGNNGAGRGDTGGGFDPRGRSPGATRRSVRSQDDDSDGDGPGAGGQRVPARAASRRAAAGGGARARSAGATPSPEQQNSAPRSPLGRVLGALVPGFLRSGGGDSRRPLNTPASSAKPADGRTPGTVPVAGAGPATPGLAGPSGRQLQFTPAAASNGTQATPPSEAAATSGRGRPGAARSPPSASTAQSVFPAAPSPPAPDAAAAGDRGAERRARADKAREAAERRMREAAERKERERAAREAKEQEAQERRAAQAEERRRAAQEQQAAREDAARRKAEAALARRSEAGGGLRDNTNQAVLRGGSSRALGARESMAGGRGNGPLLSHAVSGVDASVSAPPRGVGDQGPRGAARDGGENRAPGKDDGPARRVTMSGNDAERGPRGTVGDRRGPTRVFPPAAPIGLPLLSHALSNANTARSKRRGLTRADSAVAGPSGVSATDAENVEPEIEDAAMTARVSEHEAAAARSVGGGRSRRRPARTSASEAASGVASARRRTGTTAALTPGDTTPVGAAGPAAAQPQGPSPVRSAVAAFGGTMRRLLSALTQLGPAADAGSPPRSGRRVLVEAVIDDDSGAGTSDGRVRQRTVLVELTADQLRRSGLSLPADRVRAAPTLTAAERRALRGVPAAQVPGTARSFASSSASDSAPAWRTGFVSLLCAVIGAVGARAALALIAAANPGSVVLTPVDCLRAQPGRRHVEYTDLWLENGLEYHMAPLNPDLGRLQERPPRARVSRRRAVELPSDAAHKMRGRTEEGATRRKSARE